MILQGTGRAVCLLSDTWWKAERLHLRRSAAAHVPTPDEEERGLHVKVRAGKHGRAQVARDEAGNVACEGRGWDRMTTLLLWKPSQKCSLPAAVTPVVEVAGAILEHPRRVLLPHHVFGATNATPQRRVHRAHGEGACGLGRVVGIIHVGDGPLGAGRRLVLADVVSVTGVRLREDRRTGSWLGPSAEVRRGPRSLQRAGPRTCFIRDWYDRTFSIPDALSWLGMSVLIMFSREWLWTVGEDRLRVRAGPSRRREGTRASQQRALQTCQSQVRRRHARRYRSAEGDVAGPRVNSPEGTRPGWRRGVPGAIPRGVPRLTLVGHVPALPRERRSGSGHVAWPPRARL